MTNEGFSRVALALLDRLTDAFPETVPPLFQSIFLATVGSPLVARAIIAKYRRAFRRINLLQSILIVADVGIGDALIVQQSIVAMRSMFPAARIDYVCNRPAGEFLHVLPQVDRVYPVFEAHGKPSDESYESINAILSDSAYSTVLNFCPFLDGRRLSTAAPVLNLYVPLSAYLIGLWRSPAQQRHISTAVRTFLHQFFSGNAPGPFAGNEIYVSDASIDQANDFLAARRIHLADRLVFFNPDSTSRYGRIPFGLQRALLQDLGESDEVSAILIGEAYAEKGVERKLVAALPPRLQSRCVIVPHMPLPAYVAVVDACDVFLSGDGGPVHAAAAWKRSVSGNRTLRNRTAVFTVFGGTDAQMYGYDSEQEGYVPAAQWAPSKVIVAPAPCRNITCVDKLGKTCREVRCFAGLQAHEVSQQVISYLRSSERIRHSA